MLNIFNIKDKQEYIRKVAELTQKEWGSQNLSCEELRLKINRKMSKIIDNLDNELYCKLILLSGTKLVGFISIFPTDGDERKDLSPWYATMYVKEEFRGKRLFKNT